MMLLIGHKGTTYCVYGSYHKGKPTNDPMQPPEPSYFDIDKIEYDNEDVTDMLPNLDTMDIAGYARDICEAGGDE